MSLVQALQETNELLRASITATTPREREAPSVDLSTTRHVSEVVPYAAMLALRDSMKPIAAEYFKLRSDGSARIGCHCREALQMRPGFADCKCGRTFAYTGRRVLVLK